MAYNPRSLVLFASCPIAATAGTDQSTCKFFVYADADAAATILAAGYFNADRDKLKVNDVIIIMSVATGTGDLLIVKVTAAPATGNVTVAVNSEASGS
jgi:hypothetical protein